MKKTVRITTVELIGCSGPPKNYIIDKLIIEGAPIELKHPPVRNKLTLQIDEYHDDQICYTGEVTRYQNPNWTYVIYEFEKEENL